MHDFQNFRLQNALHDAGFLGNPFTWSNNCHGANRIWQLLDRALLSYDFLDHYEFLKFIT